MMKKQAWRVLFTVVIVIGLGLSGCDLINQQSTTVDTTFTPMSVATADCSYGGEIKSVEAVDAYTVKFTLCSSDVVFPVKLASPVLAVQDSDFLDKYKGDSIALSKNVNGTGAFKVKQQGEAEPLQLRVNNTYWGTPPKVTDILVDWYLSTSGPLSSYELTIVDVANTMNKNAEDSISQNSKFSAISHPPANVIYLGFNNKIAPFDKVEVRQAMASLLDINALVNKVFPSGSVVAEQLIPSNFSPGYTKTLRWYEQRPKDAQDLLSSVSFDYSQKLVLTYERAPKAVITSYENLALAIRDQLQTFGISVNLEPLNSADFQKALANGSSMMFLGSIQAQYLDAAAFYEVPFFRQETSFGNPYSEIQTLFKKTQAEPSAKVRQADFDEMNTKFKEQVPLIPIGSISTKSFVRSGDSNAIANPYYENYEDISNISHTIQILEMNRPVSLWPADETDWDTFRITRLLYDTLVKNSFGSNELSSGLADSWKTNSDATEWTFYLRYNIKFTNGAALDANDVVASFAAIWDASSPNHTGRTGEFKIFKQLFGGFINQ